MMTVSLLSLTAYIYSFCLTLMTFNVATNLQFPEGSSLTLKGYSKDAG